ncbi:MAG: hypothetical protein HFI97_01540 [Lachnospiraceae bacterium]|jgi:hypothetical protein|nr:hypothetical protein [Lachnospiraceae bacterium]MCI9202376.1 hypothetical protein [Lachnospiraceae bacterium]
MDALLTAPGVVKKASRLFITSEDVMLLFGCKQSKAYDIVREVNNYAKAKGYRPLPSGKANKYIFADIYNLPIEEVNRVINEE